MVHLISLGARVLLLRPELPLGADTLEEVTARLQREVSDRGGRAVLVADLRKAPLLDARTAEAVVQTMSRGGAGIEREALLLRADSATQLMQTNRLIRESGTLTRRAFTDVEQLVAWMGEAVTPADRDALRTRLEGAK